MEEDRVPSPAQPEEEGLVYNIYYWLQTLVLAVVAALMLFYHIKIKKASPEGLLVNQLADQAAAAEAEEAAEIATEEQPEAVETAEEPAEREETHGDEN